MSGKLSSRIVDAIRSVVGPASLGLHEPRLSGNEMAYLQECIETTHVASTGRFTEQFESQLSEYTGAEFVVSMASGTAALHIALLVAGVSNGDEVLIPALTFVATANAVTYCGAIPHFVDCDDITLGIDVDRLRDYLLSLCKKRGGLTINKNTGRIIRAIVPVHTFGHPSNLQGLMDIANEFNLILIEDAAESIGSLYCNRHTGTFGQAGILSFNGNKTITTGGGGAILTNHPEFAKQARHLSRTARKQHPWEYVHDAVGYNYRLPNLNAALGCAQLECLPSLLSAKRKLFDLYDEVFTPIDGVSVFKEPDECRSNYWLQTLVLSPEYKKYRSQILREANEAGLALRPPWNLITSLLPYKSAPRMPDLSIEETASCLISIPSLPHTL